MLNGFNRLDGSICTTYEVNLRHINADNSTQKSDRLCDTMKLCKGSINSTQRAEIELSYDRGTFYRANCYFWCTKSGDLPPGTMPDIYKNLSTTLVITIFSLNFLVKPKYVWNNE